MQATEYKIVTESIPSKLADTVQRLILQGWQPQGGPVCETERWPADRKWHQAMAKLK
jgi:hypothetical protein